MELRLHRASRWFFSISGAILAIGAIAFATKQLNFGIDFESGTRIQAALSQPASVDEIRSALVDGGIDGAGSAKIQETENPDFGANVVQIQAKIPPSQVRHGRAAAREGVRTSRPETRASTRPRSGRPSASRSRARR